MIKIILDILRQYFIQIMLKALGMYLRFKRPVKGCLGNIQAFSTCDEIRNLIRRSWL